MALDRAGLLALATLDREEVAIPGGSVFVRVMTAAERDRMDESHRKAAQTNFRSRLAVATICDADGQLLFAPDDLAAVGAVPVTILEPILEVAVRLNGLSADEREAARKN